MAEIKKSSPSRATLIAATIITTGALAIGTLVATSDDGRVTKEQAQAGLDLAQKYINQDPLPTVAPTLPPTFPPSTPGPTLPTPGPTTSTQPPVDPPGVHNSGQLFSDGVWAEHDDAQAVAFAKWRGKPIDNITAFVGRETWVNIRSNWWAATIPSDGSFVPARDDFILSVPLWADDGQPGSDADWRTLADQVEAVDPDGVIRLGWEMNCCTSKATQANKAQWRAQWTRAYNLMKSADPGLKIGFNPNEGTSGSGLLADPRELYVDGKVDWVGIDAYDWYPGYTNQANWDQHRTKPFGWDFWYNFAVSKGIPFALPEWGVYTASSASGGDNPAYIKYVYTWLKQKAIDRPGSILFVSYFNGNASYYKIGLYPPNVNPKAGAEYKRQLTSSKPL